MPSAVQRLLNAGVISPPKFLQPNLMLEVTMGSRAYGCEEPGSSDYDIYGVCIPPKVYVFPATDGLIDGFDDIPRFRQWQEHHVKDPDGKREYDFSVYGIVRFFELAAENNPNIVDMLFVHETLVKHCTPVGRLIMDNRKLFLSKLCWLKFRGYAAAQWAKLKKRDDIRCLQWLTTFENQHSIPHDTTLAAVEEELKRRQHQVPTRSMKLAHLTRKELDDYQFAYSEVVKQHGRAERIKTTSYDQKFAYHCIRLMREAEQILTEGDLDLFAGKEELKAIRRGEWSLDRLEKEFLVRKVAVEETFAKCTLPTRPDHGRLKQLLLDCLESHYGSLAKIAPRPDASANALREIEAVLERYRS